MGRAVFVAFGVGVDCGYFGCGGRLGVWVGGGFGLAVIPVGFLLGGVVVRVLVVVCGC